MEAFPDSEWRQERRFNRKGVVLNIHRVLDAIKNLKNNKSPGLDNILNEYLKNSTPELTRI